jgi:hypothetical protein
MQKRTLDPAALKRPPTGCYRLGRTRDGPDLERGPRVTTTRSLMAAKLVRAVTGLGRRNSLPRGCPTRRDHAGHRPIGCCHSSDWPWHLGLERREPDRLVRGPGGLGACHEDDRGHRTLDPSALKGRPTGRCRLGRTPDGPELERWPRATATTTRSLRAATRFERASSRLGRMWSLSRACSTRQDPAHHCPIGCCRSTD